MLNKECCLLVSLISQARLCLQGHRAVLEDRGVPDIGDEKKCECYRLSAFRCHRIFPFLLENVNTLTPLSPGSPEEPGSPCNNKKLNNNSTF